MSPDTAASYTTFVPAVREARKIPPTPATIPMVMEDRSEPSDPGVAADGPHGPGVDWAAALQSHARWLRRVILTRLGERQAVDEVMQEVCLAAVAQPAPAV